MFTCNVFRMFLVFCVSILQFFVITTLLTDFHGHWRVPRLLCAYELHGLLVLSGVLFLMWLSRPVVPVPFLLMSPGDHFMRCLQAVPSAAFTRHRTFLSLMVGANLLTYRHTQAVNFLRPAIGGWIVTEKLLLLSLTVVSAVFEFANRTRDWRGGRPISLYTTIITSRASHNTTISSAGIPLQMVHCSARPRWAWCGQVSVWMGVAGVCVGALCPQVHTPTRIASSENKTREPAICIYSILRSTIYTEYLMWRQQQM